MGYEVLKESQLIDIKNNYTLATDKIDWIDVHPLNAIFYNFSKLYVQDKEYLFLKLITMHDQFAEHSSQRRQINEIILSSAFSVNSHQKVIGPFLRNYNTFIYDSTCISS